MTLKQDALEASVSRLLEMSDDEKHALDIGTSIGRTTAEHEALAAHAAGELDLWLEYIKPKTSEEWDAWRSKHDVPENDIYAYSDRWH